MLKAHPGKMLHMFEPEDGAIAFVEFFTKDLAASKKFLRNVFGWKTTKTTVEGFDIWTFEAGNGPQGHMMAPMGKMAPGTVAFVRVRSVDAVSRRVTKNGGKILVPKYEVQGAGWFAWFEAPGGTIHAVFQPKV